MAVGNSNEFEFMTDAELRRFTAKKMENVEKELIEQRVMLNKIFAKLVGEVVESDIYEAMTIDQLRDEIKKMEHSPKGYALMKREKLLLFLRGEK